MDPPKKSQNFNVLDSTQSQSKPGDLKGTHVPIANVGEVVATASTLGDVSVRGMLRSSQSSQSASYRPIVMHFIAGVPSAVGSHNQSREVASAVFPTQEAISRKVVSLVHFLLFKCRNNQIVTKAEMLAEITRAYELSYHVIFTKASDCMWLLFGTDVIEVYPLVHSYFFVPALGITYDRMKHGLPGIPKTGLVIIVLCIIFLHDNCVSEEELWPLLNNIGLYAGSEHFMYGEPRKLITEHFVQEGYLEYRLVPGSLPPSRDFLWGPRARAENTKMKVWMFFASIVRQHPRSNPFRYAEALVEELLRS
ncbi:melanoma-associated antigen 10-like [Arvicanthis niloticus]|uniref:melanoma-associated antigen 10-like n=1 Tax=Arvicanthis niloticus TaxID=61156 RepID=UPI00148674CB|nr:melanoma-associated antigen 10-like [Arvicanthis niloticus]XP_034341920.1 melanoma-associated antigen 10-like [Arvicanthis niloticus]